MWNKKWKYFKYGLMGIVLIFFLNAEAQIQKPPRIKIAKQDTLQIYRNLKKATEGRKFTRFLFQTIFVDPAPLKYEKKPLSVEQIKQDPNLKFIGRHIRSIQITVLDPFGNSVNDTLIHATNTLQKLGNKAHLKSLEKVIKNRLLFKNYEKVEIIKITESERLLRAASFIRDARILISGDDQINDSVDVFVLVQDKWSLFPELSGLSTSDISIGLKDRNLFGLGQTFEQKYYYSTNTGYELNGRYSFSNIKRSYISADFFYLNSSEETSVGLAFDRSFYSLLTKYAGGIALNKTWGEFYFYDSLNSILNQYDLNYTYSDFWVAKAVNRATYKPENMRKGSFVGAIRFADMRFQNRPSFEIDTAKRNVNTELFLGSIGYSLRNFYKDQYVYRFGANEDIEEGLLIEWTNGFYKREEALNRNYSGIEISSGKHYKKLGYLSGYASFGTFYRAGIKSIANLNLGFNYFSNISLEGRWYLRQFVNGKFVTGFNKDIYDRTTLSTGEMFGLSSGSINGTSKIVLNMETVAYAPFNILGFKFAPVAAIGFGILQTDKVKLTNSPFYQAYIIGVLVRNESLVLSSFQINFGIYPNVPGQDKTVFKFNPISSISFKVRSFGISKPEPVGYD